MKSRYCIKFSRNYFVVVVDTYRPYMSSLKYSTQTKYENKQALLWRLCVLLDVFYYRTLRKHRTSIIRKTWLTTRVLFPYLQKKVAVFTKSAVSVLWGPPCGQTKNRKKIMRGNLSEKYYKINGSGVNNPNLQNRKKGTRIRQ